MKVLLDTYALIWAVSDAEKLSVSASSLLEASDTEIFVSVISCAEVACLADWGRITLDRHWKTWFNQAVELNQWQTVEIGLDVIQEAYSLPSPFHRDPADRIITATARLQDLSIITADDKILSYPHVDTVW